jgi:hypothetical protein
MAGHGAAPLGGRNLTLRERYARFEARVEALQWLGRRLPRDLGRYTLKVGGAPGGSATRRAQALEEARRLGWLKKPVMDD